MLSSFQAPLSQYREFQPGVHVVTLSAATKSVHVRQTYLDLQSNKRNASYCRFAFPAVNSTDLVEALSRKLAEADKLFDWSHQVPAPFQKRSLISLIAQLGCLIVGRYRPLHDLNYRARQFAEAAFMESDLDDRFSRFIESLHEWALPPGIGDAFISYSRCLTRERQIYTLMFLENGLNLIEKLVSHATSREEAALPGASYIILDDLDLFSSSTDQADAFLASVQDFAVSVGVVVLGVSGSEKVGSEESRHPSRAPAIAV